jgi:Flp pilus assembly protein TadG
VIFLAGEWVGAWLGMSITFLVASLGVVGLGWWVLRKDAMNRAAEDAAEKAAAPESQEGHH